MTAKRLFLPLLFLFAAFALTACAETTTAAGLDYDDFDYIEDYDEIFDRRAGTYIVYLYSESCHNCATIKSEILAFASAYDDHVLFFFNVGEGSAALQNDYKEAIGITEVQTPVLLLITDNGFDKTASSRFYFAGVTAIRAILNDLENGSYQYWQ